MNNNLILVLILVILFFCFYRQLNFGNVQEDTEDIIAYTKKNKAPDSALNKKIKEIKDPYKSIKLEPYGCFSNLEQKFFLKKINRNTHEKVFDSGITIEPDKLEQGFSDLITEVKIHGYSDFANKMNDKLKKVGWNNITIQEIGILGKYAGYDYLTIYKIGLNEKGRVYLSYSPPMELHNTTGIFSDEKYNANLSSSDLPNYTLTPELNNYTNDSENEKGKEIGCGFPCLPFDKPDTFVDSKGITRQYMCGSINYPTIKTPPRYAVYEIKLI